MAISDKKEKIQKTKKNRLKANSVPAEQAKANLLKRNLILLGTSPGLSAGDHFDIQFHLQVLEPDRNLGILRARGRCTWVLHVLTESKYMF